jgi:hypothetical protein
MKNNENVLKDLFVDSRSKRNLSIFYAFGMALLIYQAAVFHVFKIDEIESKHDIDSFELNFVESSESVDESRTVDDGEREVVTYDVSESMFQSNSGMGLLLINVAYGETSGEIADPCDTVTVDLVPNQVPADWNNVANVLTGTSDNCESISLQLMVFPEYSGSTTTVEGGTQQQWIQAWTNPDYGNGEFELGIEVNVNAPITSGIPTVQDSDEEVTITWEAVFFEVSVTQI